MHLPTTRGRRRALLATTTLAAALAFAGGAGAKTTCACGSSSTAKGAPGTVKVNKGYTLSVRARPNSGARVVRRLKNNTKVRIVCQTTGSRMTGRFGTSTLWNKLAKGGYVTDTYVYTGSDGRVAPDCPRKANPNPNPGGGRPASVTLKNDYPYPSADWNKADPWNFFFRECTSFVAFRVRKVIPDFYNQYKGGRFGDARNWDDNARAIGMKVNRTPKVGAVMVRDSGTYGHVAIVAKVADGGKRIFVEQYNAGGTHNYSKQWLSSAGMSFIHP